MTSPADQGIAAARKDAAIDEYEERAISYGQKAFGLRTQGKHTAADAAEQAEERCWATAARLRAERDERVF
jgi:hypothetical protein